MVVYSHATRHERAGDNGKRGRDGRMVAGYATGQKTRRDLERGGERVTDFERASFAPQSARTVTELDMAAALYHARSTNDPGLEAHACRVPDLRTTDPHSRNQGRALSCDMPRQVDRSPAPKSTQSPQAVTPRKFLAEEEDLWAAAEKANRAAHRRARFLAVAQQQQ